MNPTRRNNAKFIIAGVSFIVVVIVCLLIIAKRDHSEKLNHDFKRDLKYISVTSIKGFDLSGVNIQKVKAFNHNIYVYDIIKNQIIETDWFGNTIKKYGSFGNNPGQFQVVINYEIRKNGLYTIDHKNKFLTHWDFDGNVVSFLKLDRLGRAIFINTDTILCKIADKQTVDDIFAYYYPGSGSYKKLPGLLPIYHDRGIANDGFFANNGNLFFHIAYYTKDIYVFNSNKFLFKFSTVDDNDKPPIALKVNNTFSPPSDAIATNGEAAANDKYLFVLSQIRSKYENTKHFDAWSDIDVYSVKDGKYLFTYAIENYKGHFISFFDVVDNKIVILQGNHISIVNQ